MSKPLNNPSEQLSAFLDGELPAAEAAEMERRLADNPALRLELEELAEVKRLVGALPRLGAPASIRAAVRERLERRSLAERVEPRFGTSGWWGRFVRVAAMAAMLMIVATLAYTVWLHVGPVTPPAEPLAPDHLAKTDADKDAVADLPGKSVPDEPAAPSFGEKVAGLTEDDAARALRQTELAKNDLSGAAGKIAAGDTSLALAAKPGVPAYARAPQTPLAAEQRDRGLDVWRERKALVAKDAPGLSLASQLRLGPVTVADVMNHSFDREPLRLEIAVNDAAQQEKLSKDVRQTLGANGAVPVDQLDGNVRLTPDDHSFYLLGRADRNYVPADRDGEVQIIVRAPREVVEEVVAQARDEAGGLAKVQAKARFASARPGRPATPDVAAAAEAVDRPKTSSDSRGGATTPAPCGPMIAAVQPPAPRAAPPAATQPTTTGRPVVAAAPAQLCPLPEPPATPAAAPGPGPGEGIADSARSDGKVEVPPGTAPADEPRSPGAVIAKAVAGPPPAEPAGGAGVATPDAARRRQDEYRQLGYADKEHEGGTPGWGAGELLKQRDDQDQWVSLVIDIYVADARQGAGQQAAPGGREADQLLEERPRDRDRETQTTRPAQ